MRQELLKKLHKCEVVLLDEFVRLCDADHLAYYLFGGTLLGAVRHQGFIPWDDDIDVAMPRRDYEKFLTIAEEKLSDKYYLQTRAKSDYYSKAYAKLRMNNTICVSNDAAKRSKRHPGIWIDIFPLDSGTNQAGIYEKGRRRISKFLSDNIRMRKREEYLPMAHRVISFLPIQTLSKISDILLSGEGDYYLCYSGLYANIYGIERETIAKFHYDPPIELEFEGKMYKAPKDYDFYLRQIYGDNYMIIPPVSERKVHNIIQLNFDTNGPDEALD